MKLRLLTFLLIFCNILAAKNLLIIANPKSFNGYLTKQVQTRGLGCTIYESELVFANSDFGQEVSRIIPILKRQYFKVEVMYLHKSLNPEMNLQEILDKYADYEIYFLDHHSSIKMFGIPSIEFVEILQNATNPKIYLGTCNGIDLFQKPYITKTEIYVTDVKYYGFSNSSFNLPIKL